MLSQEIYKELEDLLGPENVSREPAVLDTYIWQLQLGAGDVDPDGFCRYRPAAVVLPGSTEDVRAVVKICGKHNIQFKALSTGVGSWNAPGGENVIQIDLRRMNRILEIDEKNMYAVVEPAAVYSQLQAEVMKRGLNCHVIGAGCSTSPLAGATSTFGYGWSGLTTSYGGRTSLGIEWVLPTGEILRLGTPGQGEEWFNGDGPGPSLKGVMRGITGAWGGLGVFTKCAVKLFPWSGPREPEIEGLMFDIKTEVPDTHGIFVCLFPDPKKLADAGHKIADAEIGYTFARNPIGMAALFMGDAFQEMSKFSVLKSIWNTFRYEFQLLIAANTPREYEYQEKVLRQIIEECEGVLIDGSKLEAMYPTFWWWLVRAAVSALALTIGGGFGTSCGALETWDYSVYQSDESAKIKQEYIDKGALLDDLADLGWGGIYEGSAGFGHMEELFVFDSRDPKSAKLVNKYLAKTYMITKDKNVNPGITLAQGAVLVELLGPFLCDYHLWLRKIKKAFDPDNLSDSNFYISTDPERLLREEAEKKGTATAIFMEMMEEK